MSAILLASTLREGDAYLRKSRLSESEVVAIITPRTANGARGLSVTHVFRTPGYRALPGHLRNPVEFFAAPALATSDCVECLAGKNHGRARYVLRSSHSIGENHSGVLVDESGNFDARTWGDPRALSAVLRLIADAIDVDVDHG